MSFSAIAPLPVTPADCHTPMKHYFITPMIFHISTAARTALTKRAPARWDSRQHWLLFWGREISLQVLFCPWSFLVTVWGRREFCNCRGLCFFSLLLSLSTMWSGLLCHPVFAFWSTELPVEPSDWGRGFSTGLFSLLPRSPWDSVPLDLQVITIILVVAALFSSKLLFFHLSHALISLLVKRTG